MGVSSNIGLKIKVGPGDTSDIEQGIEDIFHSKWNSHLIPLLKRKGLKLVPNLDENGAQNEEKNLEKGLEDVSGHIEDQLRRNGNSIEYLINIREHLSELGLVEEDFEKFKVKSLTESDRTRMVEKIVGFMKRNKKEYIIRNALNSENEENAYFATKTIGDNKTPNTMETETGFENEGKMHSKMEEKKKIETELFTICGELGNLAIRMDRANMLMNRELQGNEGIFRAVSESGGYFQSVKDSRVQGRSVLIYKNDQCLGLEPEFGWRHYKEICADLMGLDWAGEKYVTTKDPNPAVELNWEIYCNGNYHTAMLYDQAMGDGVSSMRMEVMHTQMKREGIELYIYRPLSQILKLQGLP